MSFFDSRISCLQSRAMLSFSSLSMLAERLHRLTNKKRANRPKHKLSLSGPALQGRMFQYSDDIVDEAKPETCLRGFPSRVQ